MYNGIFRDGNNVSVSANTVFLIQRLLVKDPKHRLLADQVCALDFIRKIWFIITFYFCLGIRRFSWNYK